MPPPSHRGGGAATGTPVYVGCALHPGNGYGRAYLASPLASPPPAELRAVEVEADDAQRRGWRCGYNHDLRAGGPAPLRERALPSAE